MPKPGQPRTKPSRMKEPINQDELNRILLKHTGHPLEKIEKDTDRDRFMSAEEALEYGLIDHVIEHVEPS